MSSTHDFDIVINGGGMAGLSQALALSGLGLRIALIDKQAAPPAVSFYQAHRCEPVFSDRVSALTPASKEFLAGLGAWSSLESLRLCPYRHMQVWDADGTGSIQFAADELHLDNLGHIVENDLVTSALVQALGVGHPLELNQNMGHPPSQEKGNDMGHPQQRHGTPTEPNFTMGHPPHNMGHPLCKFIMGQSLSQLHPLNPGWELVLDSGEMLTCSLLIGADGGNSRVRELAGFDAREWSYKQQALVCTVKTAKPHAFTCWQRFMQSGPLAYLPLFLPGAAEQHYCSIVWSCDEPLATLLLGQSPAEFAASLELGLESRLGKVELLSSPKAFPLQQRHAREYVKPGVALIGDAAHTIHPLAGQGINLGLADVKCLTEVIGHAQSRGENFASLQVLSRYQSERKPANLAMMLGMEGFKRAFGSDDLLVRFLRNQGLNLADTISPLKHQLMQHAMGLKT